MPEQPFFGVTALVGAALLQTWLVDTQRAIVGCTAPWSLAVGTPVYALGTYALFIGVGALVLPEHAHFVGSAALRRSAGLLYAATGLGLVVSTSAALAAVNAACAGAPAWALLVVAATLTAAVTLVTIYMSAQDVDWPVLVGAYAFVLGAAVVVIVAVATESYLWTGVAVLIVGLIVFILALVHAFQRDADVLPTLLVAAAAGVVVYTGARLSDVPTLGMTLVFTPLYLVFLVILVIGMLASCAHPMSPKTKAAAAKSARNSFDAETSLLAL